MNKASNRHEERESNGKAENTTSARLTLAIKPRAVDRAGRQTEATWVVSRAESSRKRHMAAETSKAPVKAVPGPTKKDAEDSGRFDGCLEG